MSLERNILKGLVAIGIGVLPFLLRKQKMKDAIIVFFFTSFGASLLDGIVVKSQRIIYPVRLFQKLFDNSILFDYLLLPITCTFYMQMTEKAKPLGILGKALTLSVPITLLEWWLEKRTNLIVWVKWSVWHTLISLTLYLLGARVVLALIQVIKKLKSGQLATADKEVEQSK